ncbi:MAG: hypothetical protein QOI35_3955, partial [Cryptosporangiaceae bacterium]|nr:hypothetical protein [Cryptosporangiaceae bacterium]
VPIMACDARSRDSTKMLLIALVEYVLTLRGAAPAGAPAS